MDTRRRKAEPPTILELLAQTRLSRFERVAAAAEASGSPTWKRLARLAARQAYADYLRTVLAAEAVRQAA